MDKSEYVDRRRKRYQAQLLDDFEKNLVPLIPTEHGPAVDQFKSTVRKKLSAFAVDLTDVLELDKDGELNGYAIQIRDRVHPGGRPRTPRTATQEP